MKKTNMRNLIGGLLLFLGATVLANPQILDLWHSQDDEQYTYIDSNSEEGKIEIEAVKGSFSEKLNLQVSVQKKYYSNTEKARYVGIVKNGMSLPAKITLKRANRSFDPIGSGSEGDIIIEEGNKEAIAGTLFGTSFEAKAERAWDEEPMPTPPIGSSGEY